VINRILNRRARHALLTVLIPATLTGCGLTERIAMNTMIPIMDGSVESAYRQGDLELVGQGLPGNILLVDGLIRSRPDDDRLLTMGTQLYFSYAVGFVEDGNPERAVALYERAMEYGFSAYPSLSPTGILDAEREAAYRETLDGLDIDDVPGLMWLTGSWASWIKLNLNESAALIQLPWVEALAVRVAELDGAFMYGMPHMMLGTIHALRPEPLGGDPARALAEFEKGFQVSDRKFLLMHAFFARYYCRQIFDEELYRKTVDELLDADATALPEALLLNRLAKQQGEWLNEMGEEFF
jgi:hypothetical protein